MAVRMRKPLGRNGRRRVSGALSRHGEEEYGRRAVPHAPAMPHGSHAAHLLHAMERRAEFSRGLPWKVEREKREAAAREAKAARLKAWLRFRHKLVALHARMKLAIAAARKKHAENERKKVFQYVSALGRKQAQAARTRSAKA